MNTLLLSYSHSLEQAYNKYITSIELSMHEIHPPTIPAATPDYQDMQPLGKWIIHSKE